MNTLIVGLQYGDEGKGRVSEYYARTHDWCVRFNGGPNAGHTVYDSEGKKHAFHHLPAGIVHDRAIALDAGMVIDPEILTAELAKLNFKPDLYISEAAHIISNGHKQQDVDGSGIGTTKRGIAYVYADKALRKGERWGNRNIGNFTYTGLVPAGKDEDILFESAQGLMLDIDYGRYPYVTSSNVMPSSAYQIDHKVGVMKAYTSRVGDGPPYIGEIKHLTQKGQEYGTTTGRPRKCFWVDIDELDYSISIVRPNEIVVTKLDILEGEDICIVEHGEIVKIGPLNTYIDFLISKYPQITKLSFAPQGNFKEI